MKLFGGLPRSIPGTLKVKVLAVLDRYADVLNDGSSVHLYPDPGYEWKAYKDMTVEQMRAKLLDADTYISGQQGWVERNKAAGSIDAGPELIRLPDAALVAMFQELDAVYASEPLPASAAPPPE